MEQLDFCDPKLFDDPWQTYAWLRAEAPMYRDTVNNIWVVSRHADVSYVSRHPELYCSGEGVRPVGAGALSLVAMDDPEHTRVRRLVNRGFTPRQVRQMVPHAQQLARDLVDEIASRGEVEFVSEFAIHIPLIVIAEMLGLDPEQRQQLYKWSDAMMAGDGHFEPGDPVLHEAAVAFGEYAELLQTLIAERKENPSDDIITILAEAAEDGAFATDEVPLDEHELIMFLVTLLVAGNETTRNGISGGLLALDRFPDERARLLDHLDDADFVDLAVDELIRFVSPVLSFSRTVTEDHTYEGEDFTQELKAGDVLLMLYQSANRDERVFDDPKQLILDRNPNPHLAFGVGTHFCLGANLARMELRVVFDELFRRLPDIAIADGPLPPRGDSALVLAIQDLPATFTPVRPHL